VSAYSLFILRLFLLLMIDIVLLLLKKEEKGLDTTIFEQLLSETKQTSKQTDKLVRIDLSAIELFAEKGFANTSTKEIASRADVAEGTIFKHYKTKENLLLNILLKFLKVLMPSMKKEILEKLSQQEFKTFSEFFDFFLRNRIDFILANRDVFRIFVKELIYNDELRTLLFSNTAAEIVEVIYKYYDQFKATGELREVDNAKMLKFMLKTVLADAVWTFMLTDYYLSLDIDQWIKERTDEFLIGMGNH